MKQEQDYRSSFEKEKGISTIFDVSRDAQARLLELANRVKSEKVDKNRHPVDRALETVQFASTLIAIPSVREFLTRDKKTGVMLVHEEDHLSTFKDWDVIIFDEKTISYGDTQYEGRESISIKDDPDKFKETFQSSFDTGDTRLLNKLANLKKRDVVRIFRDAVKA